MLPFDALRDGYSLAFLVAAGFVAGAFAAGFFATAAAVLAFATSASSVAPSGGTAACAGLRAVLAAMVAMRRAYTSGPPGARPATAAAGGPPGCR